MRAPHFLIRVGSPQRTARVFTVALAIAIGLLATSASSQTDDDAITTYSGGVSTMLSCPPVQCSRKSRQDLFRIDPGAPLRIEFSFIQSYPEAKTFRIFLLLNYRQTPFAVEQVYSRADEAIAPFASPIPLPQATEMRPVLEFSAPPEEQIDFDLHTGPLISGYYDLALLIVPDPQLTQREMRYWSVYRFVTRASVYVGASAQPPQIEYPVLDLSAVPNSEIGDLLLFVEQPPGRQLSGGVVATPGEEITLTMHFQPHVDNLADGLPPDAPLPTAFVAFIDDQTVPLNGQPVLYGSAPTDRLSSFPVTITAPEQPGTYQLFVEQFPNPYVDARKAEKTGRWFWAISSQRLTLQVR